MKLAQLGGLLVLVAMTTSAYAEKPVGEVTEAVQGEVIKHRINTALAAIKNQQAGKASALMADAVTIEGLPIKAAACKKAFGGAKRIEVTGAARARLVTCLAKETWFATTLPFRVEKMDGTWTVWMQLVPQDFLTEIQLATKPDGTVVIKGVHAPLFDGEEGGAAGKKPPEPVAGGVVYINPYIPPPPLPPGTPMNVPPTLLEGNRLTGTKQIVPDDPTKLAIQQSGRDKIIASIKMCLDDKGAVTLLKMLKSSGFPTYDRAIEAGMKTWTYRPYLVDGTAVPVCTAVTFIYTQK